MANETTQIEKGFNSIFQDFVSDGIARIAVPIFFTISGYLYFYTVEKANLRLFWNKFKKKVITIFFPFLIWSFYGILFYLILQSIPQAKPFFTSNLVIDYSLKDWFATLFFYTIPYQLWFMRDLFLIIIFAPIIYYGIKTFRLFFVLAALIIWLNGIDFRIFYGESFLFFVIGAYLGIQKVNIDISKYKNLAPAFILLWLLLIAMKIYLINNELSNALIIRLIHKVSLIVGSMAIWLLYDYLFGGKDLSNSKIYQLSFYSFFIYAYHEPVLTTIKKASYFIVGKSATSSFLIYIFAPVVIMIFGVFIAKLLKNKIPNIYYFITGGRG